MATDRARMAAFAAFSNRCAQAANEHAKIVKDLRMCVVMNEDPADELQNIAVTVQLGNLKGFRHNFIMIVPRHPEYGMFEKVSGLKAMLSRMFGIEQDAFIRFAVLDSDHTVNNVATNGFCHHIADSLYGSVRFKKRNDGTNQMVAANRLLQVIIDIKYAMWLTNGHAESLIASHVDERAGAVAKEDSDSVL